MYMQCTRSVHAVYMQCTRSVHAVYMQCTRTRTERNVNNVLFFAERSRIDGYPWIAGTIIALAAILLAAWCCVRYLVGGS